MWPSWDNATWTDAWMYSWVDTWDKAPTMPFSACAAVSGQRWMGWDYPLEPPQCGRDTCQLATRGILPSRHFVKWPIALGCATWRLPFRIPRVLVPYKYGTSNLLGFIWTFLVSKVFFSFAIIPSAFYIQLLFSCRLVVYLHGDIYILPHHIFGGRPSSRWSCHFPSFGLGNLIFCQRCFFWVLVRLCSLILTFYFICHI